MFTVVRAWTDEQTARETEFISTFQFCWKFSCQFCWKVLKKKQGLVNEKFQSFGHIYYLKIRILLSTMTVYLFVLLIMLIQR